jgi:hypothetical protein
VRRNLKPSCIDLVGRDADGRAVWAHNVRYLFGRKLSGNRLHVRGFQPRRKWLIVWRGYHFDKENYGCNCNGETDAKVDLLLRAKSCPEEFSTLHQLASTRCLFCIRYLILRGHWSSTFLID